MEDVEYSYDYPAKGLEIGNKLLMDDAGQEYFERRISSEESPPKPKMEFGVLPVLEMNGKQYSQSIATARYLGQKYNKAGRDIEEDFQIDEIVDYFIDLHASAAAVHYESDESIKAKKHAENSKEKYPTMLEKLNSIISENDGYLACCRLTWADYVFAGAFDHLKVMMQAPDLDEKYPNFKTVCELQDSWYAEEFWYAYEYPAKGLEIGNKLLMDDAAEEYHEMRITSRTFNTPEWPPKPKTEFGVLPALKRQGKQYSGSIAIARYLGHCYGYAGKDIEEDFQIDQIVDYFIDLYASAATVHYESDESIKAKKHAENSKEKYPTMLEKLNSIISENDGFLACGRLTWADYVFSGALDHLKVMMQAPDLDEKYPNFKTVCELRHSYIKEDGTIQFY